MSSCSRTVAQTTLAWLRGKLPRTAKRGVKESTCRCFRCAVVPLNAAPEVQGCAKPKHQQRGCQQEDAVRHARAVLDVFFTGRKARAVRCQDAAHAAAKQRAAMPHQTMPTHKQTLAWRGSHRITSMPTRSSPHHAQRVCVQPACTRCTARAQRHHASIGFVVAFALHKAKCAKLRACLRVPAHPNRIVTRRCNAIGRPKAADRSRAMKTTISACLLPSPGRSRRVRADHRAAPRRRSSARTASLRPRDRR